LIHLRLSDVDRERLGVPDEWLDVDPHSVTAREASILQRGFDLDGERITYDTPGEWRRALRGGMPDDQPARRPDFPAMLVLVWLALRRAGVTAALDALDFDLDGLAYRSDGQPEPEPDPEASPGKDDAPPTSPDSSTENTASTP
jgi:hypothetical protein